MSIFVTIYVQCKQKVKAVLSLAIQPWSSKEEKPEVSYVPFSFLLLSHKGCW